jgi:hypothetical protein
MGGIRRDMTEGQGRGKRGEGRERKGKNEERKQRVRGKVWGARGQEYLRPQQAGGVVEKGTKGH